MARPRPVGPGVEDRLEIEDLYNEYMWALDTGDTEGYLDCFAEDAELRETQADGSLWSGQGREVIRELIMKYHADPNFPGHQHRETQRIYRPDPEGRADHWWVQSYSFATAFDTASHTASLYWAGYYRDIVAKVDGEWVFVFRWIAPWKGDVLERFGAAATGATS